MKNVFLDTILDLLNIQSFSGEEDAVVEYVIPLLQEYGFTISIDDMLNVYATRGESKAYPLLNAHMDSVRGYSTKAYQNCTECKLSSKVGNSLYDVFCFKNKKMKLIVNKYTAYNCKSFDPIVVIDNEEEEKNELVATYNDVTKIISGNKTRPIGGDDKCGMAVALEIARTTDIPMKILFTVQEEVGCIGSAYALRNRREWFDDCAYGITIDRKGNNHICVTTGGTRNASNYFIAELAKWGIISNIAITLQAGSSSDNRVLRAAVPNFVNISAAYHDPHTNRETVDFAALKRIRNWVKNFIMKGDFKEA